MQALVPVIASLIRHTATALGVQVAATSDGPMQAAGAIVTLAGLAWSAWNAYRSRPPTSGLAGGPGAPR